METLEEVLNRTPTTAEQRAIIDGVLSIERRAALGLSVHPAEFERINTTRSKLPDDLRAVLADASVLTRRDIRAREIERLGAVPAPDPASFGMTPQDLDVFESASGPLLSALAARIGDKTFELAASLHAKHRAAANRIRELHDANASEHTAAERAEGARTTAETVARMQRERMAEQAAREAAKAKAAAELDAAMQRAKQQGVRV